MRKVIVLPYDERWKIHYKQEAEAIKRVFGDIIADTHHIGSTSVPGMKAKPTIDIMPLVNDIDKIDSFNEKMLELDYISKGENGIEGRRYFVKKDGADHLVHAHFYQHDDTENISRYLAFRGFLKVHETYRNEYGNLKQKLAEDDIDYYIAGKHDLVQEIELKALKWYENRLLTSKENL